MGESFVSLRENNFTENQMKDAYSKLRGREVLEASQMIFFTRRKYPKFTFVDDIAIGESKSMITFKNGDFVVLKGTVDIWKLK